MEVLKLIAERLQKLLERPDLSFEERLKIEEALRKLEAFEMSFADFSEDVQSAISGGVSHLEVLDRV